MSREWLKYTRDCFMIKKNGMGELNVNSIRVREMVIGEGIPKICVPIVENTRTEILKMAKESVNSSADMVEWRADWYESVFDLEKVVEVAAELREILGKLPLLFTFRTKAEGGEKEIELAHYRELLLAVAATSDVDMIDVEAFFDDDIAQLICDLHKKGVVVVGSNHDFEGTPSKEEIIRRLCYMQDIGADILKMAVMPQKQSDVTTLMDATKEMVSGYAQHPVVTMSMSEMGIISRLEGQLFGSSVTFGALKKTSAPGQINVEKLKKGLEKVNNLV